MRVNLHSLITELEKSGIDLRNLYFINYGHFLKIAKYENKTLYINGSQEDFTLRPRLWSALSIKLGRRTIGHPHGKICIEII